MSLAKAANFCRITWLEMSGLPKVTRSCAYCKATDRHVLLFLFMMTAIMKRSRLKSARSSYRESKSQQTKQVKMHLLLMRVRKPLFSCPMRFSTGTLTFSRVTQALPFQIRIRMFLTFVAGINRLTSSIGSAVLDFTGGKPRTIRLNDQDRHPSGTRTSCSHSRGHMRCFHCARNPFLW
jgi:hypothetical protein